MVYHTYYIFTYGGTTISRRHRKEIITTTLFNYNKIFSTTWVTWIMRLIEIPNSTHTQKTYGLTSEKRNATIIYEDSTACITQLKDDYIKEDRTKHISPKFFFHSWSSEKWWYKLQQICSCDILADHFTKSLPNETFNQLVQTISIHRRRNDRHLAEGEKWIRSAEGEKWNFLKKILYSFSLHYIIFSPNYFFLLVRF